MAQKPITEEKTVERGNKKENKQRILLCEGPAEGNGAACFIFRDELTIHANSELVIGEDISEYEAQLLLNENTWKFKEVTK
ncbi:hypothetical protein FKQ51_20175 [Bacillus toyonensis]|uniref:hypothetical protein n=1 Tax=Bacillus toyonensis TaxID=155322 RepID=UPI00270939E8|nr:hypothetical protein [Bacillus toyonensis]MDO8159628.1 hypothetical protein [Bacillus toyonensis]